MHIHCDGCGNTVLADDIYPGCDCCNDCKIIKEKKDVYCCSNRCPGTTKIWNDGELTCNRLSGHWRRVNSCDVTEKHVHCDVSSCEKIIPEDDIDPDCDFCYNCRIEMESDIARCLNGCTVYWWSGNRYVCYCDD